MKALAANRLSLPTSGIRDIMRASASIPGAIHLEVGEPSVTTPAHVREAAFRAMNEGYTHYTHNAGLPSLREAIIGWLGQAHGVDRDAHEVVVTPGAVTAIATTIMAIAEVGDEVLIPDPGWPNYEQMLINQETVPVRYALAPEHGFRPDLDELAHLVTNRTKAIIVNSPSNPTGAVLSTSDLVALLRFAERHDLYVVSDEVYDQIVFEGVHASMLAVGDTDRVISVFSFSKTYAMTGWRVGFCVAPPPIAGIVSKLQEPLVSCASSVSQKAAEAALLGPQDFVKQMRDTYRARRDGAVSLLRSSGLSFYRPSGAFYMLIDLRHVRMPAAELAMALLREMEVAVAPGATFGRSTMGMVRISLASDDTALLEGVGRIIDFAQRHG